MTDSASREVLARSECVRLLARADVGRVGLSIGAQPVILPVNYALDGARVIFSTGDGSKLDAAINGALVCFEVDRVEEQWRSGWSVLVTGVAKELVGADAEDAATALRPPWSLGAGSHVVAIPLDVVTGRRIGPVLLDR